MIDQVFPETLKILADLIKFQTVSGTSNLELIKYCEKKLNEVGVTSFKNLGLGLKCCFISLCIILTSYRFISIWR